jgi:general secretion pathway protein D
MRAVRVWSGVALVVGLALVPASFGESEELRAAIQLFDAQEYVAAQEALLKIDRATLTDSERAQLDELLKLLPEAIQGSEKARQMLADADQAYEAGRWDEADTLYQAALENRYAQPDVRTRATAQRERIAEKKKLAEAARPTGTLEETEVTGATREEPTPPPAGEPPIATQAQPVQEEGPRRLTPTEQMRMQDELRWQRAVAQAQALAARVRELIAANEYVEARRLADSALQTIEAARQYAEPVSRYEAARDEVVRLRKELEEAQQLYEAKKASAEREEIARRIAERRQQIEAQKQETIRMLFSAAEQLRKERRFSEATEALRQILRIDPANTKARYQLEMAEDYESLAEQLQWKRDLGTESRRALLNADEALIPWDYDVLYPKNWLELTARRTMTGGVSGRTAADQELHRRLEEPIPEVRFSEAPFEQVINFFAEQTGTNIAVDWANLDEALVTPARERPVTIKLSNVKFRVVLNEVLSQVGGDTRLGFTTRDGLIRIATKDKLDKDKFVVAYDVRDLLAVQPNAPAPELDRTVVGSDVRAVGQSTGGSLFSQSNTSQATSVSSGSTPAEEPQIEKLKKIIRDTVAPDSWMESGAGPGGGTIQDLNGQILVYNTSSAQEQLVDLLGKLRETQALQLSVEARVLDVSESFLEQFGVDIDFVFNSGSAGYDRAADVTDPFTGAPVLIPRQYSRAGVFPVPPNFGQLFAAPQVSVPQQPYAQAAFVPPSGGILPHISDMTPIVAQQGSIGLADPTKLNTGVPGSLSQAAGFAPALNISGSYLDNLQVDFLIRATQANKRSSIVQAPRAVMQNGQAVVIRIETSRDYVGSLEPVVGDAFGLVRPVVFGALSGIRMWVQGVISSDRRYSTLSIDIFQRGEPTFDRFEVQSGVGPRTSVSLRSQFEIRYNTTVSVPDGGTVLLGGLKQVGEIEVDAGVPILSKIPVLKRAFTNQAAVKDTRTLLILVKSKILIQKEVEEEAFPTFTGLGS